MAALDSYAILDTPAEPDFDDLVLLAAQALDVPIAVINLIASDRQWFKAQIGLAAREMPLEVSICTRSLAEMVRTLIGAALADGRICRGRLVCPNEFTSSFAAALKNSPHSPIEPAPPNALSWP